MSTTADRPDARRTPGAEVLVGLRDGLPIVLGTIPYGLVVGVSAASVGIPVAETVGLSALVYAGLSQLTVIDLLDRGTPLFVVVLAALTVNARFTMYSASIAPHLDDQELGWRLFCPFFLIGPVYGVALAAFERDDPTHYVWYYLGLALPSWGAWLTATYVGLRLGTRVPDAWHLDFVVPLVFIAIVVEFVQSRPTLVAALVSGAFSVFAVGLPLNLGFLVASVVGMLAALGFQARRA